MGQLQLAVLFPIGHMEKAEVREIARELGLPTAEAKESQDACLMGSDETSFAETLRERFLAKATPAGGGRSVSNTTRLATR